MSNDNELLKEQRRKQIRQTIDAALKRAISQVTGYPVSTAPPGEGLHFKSLAEAMAFGQQDNPPPAG
jgi:hypothetical protein